MKRWTRPKVDWTEVAKMVQCTLVHVYDVDVYYTDMYTPYTYTVYFRYQIAWKNHSLACNLIFIILELHHDIAPFRCWKNAYYRVIQFNFMFQFLLKVFSSCLCACACAWIKSDQTAIVVVYFSYSCSRWNFTHAYAIRLPRMSFICFVVVHFIIDFRVNDHFEMGISQQYELHSFASNRMHAASIEQNRLILMPFLVFLLPGRGWRLLFIFHEHRHPSACRTSIELEITCRIKGTAKVDGVGREWRRRCMRNCVDMMKRADIKNWRVLWADENVCERNHSTYLSLDFLAVPLQNSSATAAEVFVTNLFFSHLSVSSENIFGSAELRYTVIRSSSSPSSSMLSYHQGDQMTKHRLLCECVLIFEEEWLEFAPCCCCCWHSVSTFFFSYSRSFTLPKKLNMESRTDHDPSNTMCQI